MAEEFFLGIDVGTSALKAVAIDSAGRVRGEASAAYETLLVSDGEDLSTAALIQELISALGASTKLFPCSPKWLERLGRITRKSSVMERLLGTLQVDSNRIQQTLGWQPPFTTSDGVRATAEWYSQSHTRSRGTYRAA